MKITIQDDFDLNKIMESGQCFRVKYFPEDGVYRFICGGDILYLRSLSERIYEIQGEKEKWDALWSRYFDLDRDYRRVRSAASDDAYLSRAAEEGRGIRILRQEPWETLITFILSQRKSIPAIQKAVEALAASFGTPINTDRETVHAFPTVEQLAGADSAALNACGLGYRTPYIQDAVHKVLTGEINLEELQKASDEELLQTLKTIHGVGDKIANCVALFAYSRTALAPVDTWISRVINTRYGGQNPFPQYGDTAGIMQQYIFYYALKHKKEL